jgi:hypothetical protein
MPAPETVTEAVAFLESEGYTEDITIKRAGLHCGASPEPQGVDDVIVDYTFRFEGPSDPADEAIVLGIRCPSVGIKGLLVSAFGPDTDPEHIDILVRLSRR